MCDEASRSTVTEASTTTDYPLGGFMTTRKLYRRPMIREGPEYFASMMVDKRICRGSTVHKPTPQEELVSLAQQKADRRRLAAIRKKCRGYTTKGRMGTPPCVEKRRHEPVQTERYLEELYDYPPSKDAETQTDLFLDRPATPHYVPAKVGLDQETQIYPGELFDFDREVIPILEVLVGKTIEQSLIEVLEEDEVAEMEIQQRQFNENRASEKAEQLRLEEEERRLREEKEQRMREHELALRIQKETEERVAAAMLSEGYIAELVPDVLEGLKQAGFLIDDVKKDLEDHFIPWLMDEVRVEITNMLSTGDILGELIQDILQTKYQIYSTLGDNFAPLEEELIGEEYDLGEADICGFPLAPPSTFR